MCLLWHTYARGLIFNVAGTPPTSIDVHNSATIDMWSVVHEFGHAWDRHYGWRLSTEMMKYTDGDYNWPASIIKGSIGNCYAQGKKDEYPGCNAAGYYYGIKPPAGSDDNFNHREDFAEAVAAYVFPERAEEIVSKYLGTAYEDNLYYEHYSDTQRYEFVQKLLSK